MLEVIIEQYIGIRNGRTHGHANSHSVHTATYEHMWSATNFNPLTPFHFRPQTNLAVTKRSNKREQFSIHAI